MLGRGLGRGMRGQSCQVLLDAQVALGDLLLQLAVGLQGLADDEQQFGPVIPRQRRFDLGLRLA